MGQTARGRAWADLRVWSSWGQQLGGRGLYFFADFFPPGAPAGSHRKNLGEILKNPMALAQESLRDLRPFPFKEQKAYSANERHDLRHWWNTIVFKPRKLTLLTFPWGSMAPKKKERDLIFWEKSFKSSKTDRQKQRRHKSPNLE